ncbi:MAG: GNAT family N-acetyltransferase [Acidobacteriota bacterium]|nr:GNAT family N-acetyltransferase [Acidobacteriota bacterium]
MQIVQAQTTEDIEQVRVLFREYESLLAVDLCFQQFEAELNALPGKYALPDGRLLLAKSGEKIAGCVALRKIDNETCEMKRLFVRQEFRGSGLGRELAEKLIEEAREIGYRKMRLDTISDKMPMAVKLYEKLGFRQIQPYYDSPIESTVYMELKL